MYMSLFYVTISSTMSETIDELRQQLAELQEKMDELMDSTSAQIFKLNEENDLLSEANFILTQENERIREAAKNAEVSDVDESEIVPEDLLTPGDGVLPLCELRTIAQAHPMNILSVGIHHFKPEFVVSGGVNKCVKIHNWKTKQLLASYDTGAPVLCIDFNALQQFGDYLLITLMDGKHCVLKFNASENSGESDTLEKTISYSLETIQKFHDHTRQGNMRQTWLTTTFGFATASSDKSVHVYQCKDYVLGEELPSDINFELIKSYYFNGPVEAIAAIPPKDNAQELLAISVRSDCYLHYVDCLTYEKTRYQFTRKFGIFNALIMLTLFSLFLGLI